jgi:hypothetical protein
LFELEVPRSSRTAYSLCLVLEPPSLVKASRVDVQGPSTRDSNMRLWRWLFVKGKPKLLTFMNTLRLMYIVTQRCGLMCLISVPLMLVLLFKQFKSPNGEQCEEPPIECGFVGNEDAYGMGIRVGAYLQWISGILVIRFCRPDEKALIASSMTFSSALVLAILYSTFNKGCTYELEIIIILWIAVMGQLLASFTEAYLKIARVITRDMWADSCAGRLIVVVVREEESGDQQ